MIPEAIQQRLAQARDQHRAGHLREAESEYRQILGEYPDHPETLHLLGMLATTTGRPQLAVDLIQRAIAGNPRAAAYHNNLGNALKDQGKLESAAAAYRSAIQLQPGLAVAHSNLGAILFRMGRLNGAEAALRTALSLDPNLPDAHNNLGNILRQLGRLDECVAAYEAALRRRPDFAEAYYDMGNALKDSGNLDRAIECYHKALSIRPSYSVCCSSVIFLLNYHPGFDAAAIHDEQRRWNQLYAEPLRKQIQPHSNDRNPDRILRIGYVAPDFREHCQSFFTLPLLSNHDTRLFQIVCYSDVLNPDAITERIKAHAHKWQNIVGMPDQQIADLVRGDRIDILVDLTMHMGQNRLLLFARKPAPVQVTWLAYPGGTGLDAMDYRITDPYLDPPGLSDTHYTEQSIRLPETFWCYDPLVDDLEVGPLPASSFGRITFGCFNNFCKVNPAVLGLWSKVLTAVGGSRLLLLSSSGSHRQQCLRVFAENGVEPNRIEFVDKRPRRQYLERYRQIDIALDTFPYNGHTTSLDGMWMGVPTVTLIGNTAVGRAGLCHLSNIGLPELAGKTPEDFVRIATQLAGDLAQLAQLRATLRQRMQSSPLMDGPRFARNMEAAYRSMWRRWCPG